MGSHHDGCACLSCKRDRARPCDFLPFTPSLDDYMGAVERFERACAEMSGVRIRATPGVSNSEALMVSIVDKGTPQQRVSAVKLVNLGGPDA